MQSGVQLCGIIRGRDENKGAFGSRTMGCTLQAVTSLLSVYLHGHRPCGPESSGGVLKLAQDAGGMGYLHKHAYFPER